MTNEKPTNKEVIKEIIRPMKKTGKKIMKNIKDAGEANLSLYAIPTYMRKELPNLGVLGIIGLSGQGGIYTELIQNDIPAYWLPIATNVLSGLYETGRYIYKKAENRIMNKNLENKFGEKLKC